MRNSFLALSLLAFGSAACGTDAKVVDVVEPASEHGRWGLVNALRDGSATSTLAGAYLDFDTARSTVTINFTGEEIEVNYFIDDQALLTPENPMFQSLELRELTDSSLVLAGPIQRRYFEMSFRPEPEPRERPVLVRPEPSDASVPLDDDPREGRLQ